MGWWSAIVVVGDDRTVVPVPLADLGVDVPIVGVVVHAVLPTRLLGRVGLSGTLPESDQLLISTILA